MTSPCEVLFNTMSTIGEMCSGQILSPKREKILGSLDKNIEGEMYKTGETEKEKPVSLSKLRKTWWIVRASCFNKILERYQSLQKLWKVCLGEKLELEDCALIVRYQLQLESFSFFFGLLLSHRLNTRRALIWKFQILGDFRRI